VTTYPPAPLALQQKLALDYTHSQIAYVGYEGTIFHLSGPFAPVLGAQSGAVITNIAHLDAPFKHLDNKGARQDGITWYDSLYDPAEIDMSVALGGMSASDMRSVIAAWFGAWSPKEQGKLCWFSPERGEWFARVRMNKPVSDQFKQDWYQSKLVNFTWSCRNDDAFWQGVDSVDTYAHDSNVVFDSFSAINNGSLGTAPNITSGTQASNWQTNFTGAGILATPSGTAASWISSNNAAASTAVAQYVGAGGKSPVDNQLISVIVDNDMPLPTSGTGNSVNHNFSSDAGGSLPSMFTPTYGVVGTGTMGVTSGAVVWNAGLSTIFGRNGIARYNVTPTKTSRQKVSITTTGTLPGGTVDNPALSLYCRMDSGMNNYVFANIYSDAVTIGYTVLGGLPITFTKVNRTYAAGTYTLITDGINYTLLFNGAVIANCFDGNKVARTGSDYRYTGFGMYAGGNISGQINPTAKITNFSMSDLAQDVYLDIWGRMDSNPASTGSLNGIRARFGYQTVQLGFMVNGTISTVGTYVTNAAVQAGDTLSLQCGVQSPNSIQVWDDLFHRGTDFTPRQFQIYQNNIPLIPGGITEQIENFFGTNYGYRDTASASRYGESYRGWGFGMYAASNSGTQVGPSGITKWSGGSDTGWINLTNIGDQPGWPRYLVYGPGTFKFGDGDQATNMVTFGPLLAGQVALITTQPRLATVVDLTPPADGAAGEKQLGFWKTLEKNAQGLLETLVNFATNNNVPPLLQEFESLFGIAPPQGPLYSLLSGRFTTPVDPKMEQEDAVPVFIPCQIQGGSSRSKVIASLTPYRRWPE